MAVFRPTLAIAVVLCAAATPALASFHLAHIRRVMTGTGGNTDVQYVEILMDATGQNFVSGSKLIAFGADGAFDHVILTVPANVKSGKDRPWLMASAGFQAASGIAPDFVFDSSDGKGLPAKDGMVCWGIPSDQTKPDSANMIDCVSYGDFTGPPNTHTSAPTPVRPFGHGILRVAETGSSAADFWCEDPAAPTNNTPTIGSVAATSPCVGCGSGLVDDGETCDDGDTASVSGDRCSADCQLFPCGSPTSATSTKPKSSDALFVLRAGVQGSNCAPSVCDANGNGSVTATDALVILKKAVGQEVTLACPAE